MNPSTERSGVEFNSSQAERTVLPDVDLNLLKNTEVDISLSSLVEQESLAPEKLMISSQAGLVDQNDQDAQQTGQYAIASNAVLAKSKIKNGENNSTTQGRIEQVWVDEAKKIINSTSEDPHLREEKIKKLRDEYLLEKYGFKIKGANK